MASILALFTVLFSNVLIVGIVLIPVLLISIVAFILPAIALYKLATKAGYDKPWLAFIPFAQVYLEFVLPRRRYKVLFMNTHKRETMALIAILVSCFGSMVIAGLNVIPAVGQILDIALMLFLVAVNWGKRRDLLCTFTDENTAMTISIISIFVPMVYAIYLLVIMNNDPDYGEGNYYNVIIPEVDPDAEPAPAPAATPYAAPYAAPAQTPYPAPAPAPYAAPAQAPYAAPYTEPAPAPAPVAAPAPAAEPAPTAEAAPVQDNPEA